MSLSSQKRPLDMANKALEHTVPAERARLACTYCREKKIRCSRELPKCASCKPWPGACVYPNRSTQSKQAKATPSQPPDTSVSKTHVRPAVNAGTIRDILPKPVEEQHVAHTTRTDERLSRIETSLSDLVGTISTTLTSSSGSPGEYCTVFSMETCAAPATDRLARVQAQNDSQLSVNPDHSFGQLDRASQFIGSMVINSSPDTEAERLVAANTLQDLANSLKTVGLDLAASDTSSSQLTSRYFIPSKRIGYGLISTFLRIVELGDILMMKPSDEVLRRVVFEPDSVSEPSWIVFIDFILVNALVADKKESSVVQSLRANTRAALNDARVFLEPSSVNVQAFLLLASHGEDYATPNLSWMLMGHACRQMQALGPYQSSLKYEDQQRQLSLFWSLFILDKSCSLAFGRPTQLPTTVYEHIQVPDFKYLLGYHPHLDVSETPQNALASTFGAHFFTQSIELAKITGRSLELLCGTNSEAQQQVVLAQLDAWDIRTGEVLLHACKSESAAVRTEQLQEMMIGIRALRFQYLHITILVLKKYKSDETRLLAAAREALGLLTYLVSTSAQVYNGVVWQLLYYPFTPFFVIFEHLVTSTVLSNADEDLGLLAGVASYFNSMAARLTSLASVSRRLEHTAGIFYKVACFTCTSTGTTGANAFGGICEESVILQPTDAQSLPAWDTSFSSIESYCEQDVQTLANRLRSQQDTTSELDGINVEGILSCLEPDGGPGPAKRQKTSDLAFNWFNWDTYYFDENTDTSSDARDI